MDAQSLVSESYREQLRQLHGEDRTWGDSAGRKAGLNVQEFLINLSAKTVLDWGCGKGTLKDALTVFEVTEFDPGIEGKERLPGGEFDAVVCVDVMEHVEEWFIPEVMRQISLKSRRGAYFLIATVPDTGRQLPDGRNVHISLFDTNFWVHWVNEGFDRIDYFNDASGNLIIKAFKNGVTA